MAYMGDFFIFLATVFTVLSGVAYLTVWRGEEFRLNLARLLFRVSTGFILAAMSMLMYLILAHDFTVAYVFSYSSTDLPMAYLISSLWGGQEGTFLLWVFFAGIMGMFMIGSSRDYETGNMFFLNLFQLLVLIILLAKSPFELMPVWQPDGAGLNPLLQNPSSVGIPYYFITITPVAVLILILIAIFPAFRWNGGMSRPKQLILGGVVAGATVIALMVMGINEAFSTGSQAQKPPQPRVS